MVIDLGKYGKKNHVSLNPLDYNIMLLGEAKVGKTSIVKKFCEKLVGEDGYMFLEFGQERGADAIEGINYINVPVWYGGNLSDEELERMELNNEAPLEYILDDIIENKTKEYPNLKVVVWDTFDQIITIAEEEAIRLWNKECRESGHSEKCAKTINAAWGGFGKGEKKAMELMDNMVADLRKVGVKTFIIGHVKNKDVTDVVSGETYQTLTSDQQQNYFNHIKKNLHFLGLAYIDRTIIKEKTGKKNIVTGKEEVVKKVNAEARKIKFRDDNYAVDSGSRFADIVSEIEMNEDELISAIKNAILAEQKKSSVSLEDAKKKQEEKEKLEMDLVLKQEEEKKKKNELKITVNKILTFFGENKSDMNIIKPVLDSMRELGYANPAEINNVEDANKILKVANDVVKE